MKKYIQIAVIILVCLVSVDFAQAAPPVPPPPPSVPGTITLGPKEMTGWGSSSNIGFISFNCKDLQDLYNQHPTDYPTWNGICGRSNYKVSINDAGTVAGTFSGFAWSSNYGWISFNATDVAGCPTEAVQDNPPTGAYLAGGNACSPRVQYNTGQVSGWARVLSQRTEDGNGWIHLSGNNHQTGYQGVTLNPTTGVFSGSAFESTNAGWINFNVGVPTSNVTCANCVIGGGGPATPPCASSTFTVNHHDLPSTGGVVDITWNAPNATACSAVGFTNSGNLRSGTLTNVPVTVDTTMALYCSNAAYTNALRCGNPINVDVADTSSGGHTRLFISSTAGVTSGLNLNSLPGYTSALVTRGNAFYIKFVTDLPLTDPDNDPTTLHDYYVCTASATLPNRTAATNTTWPHWVTGASIDVDAPPFLTNGIFEPAMQTNITPANLRTPTGQHRFNVVCSNGITTLPTSTVQMFMVASSEEEI